MQMGFSIYRKLVIWFVFASLLSLGLATLIGIHSVGTAVIVILLSLVIAGGDCGRRPHKAREHEPR
jgi:hypothetical protein